MSVSVSSDLPVTAWFWRSRTESRETSDGIEIRIWDRVARVLSGTFFGSLSAGYLYIASLQAQTLGWDLPWKAYSDVLSLGATGLFYLMVTVLTVARTPPARKSVGLLPRLAALAGSYVLGTLPLFPRHAVMDPGWQIAAAVLVFGGTLASLLVLAYLGRSFSIMPEARRLVTSGPYGIVRHPLYLTELVSTFGIFIQFASIWTGLILLIHIAYQIQRMRYEEGVLTAAFPEYPAYAATTKRMIPFVW